MYGLSQVVEDRDLERSLATRCQPQNRPALRLLPPKLVTVLNGSLLERAIAVFFGLDHTPTNKDIRDRYKKHEAAAIDERYQQRGQ